MALPQELINMIMYKHKGLMNPTAVIYNKYLDSQYIDNESEYLYQYCSQICPSIIRTTGRGRNIYRHNKYKIDIQKEYRKRGLELWA